MTMMDNQQSPAASSELTFFVALDLNDDVPQELDEDTLLPSREQRQEGRSNGTRREKKHGFVGKIKKKASSRRSRSAGPPSVRSAGPSVLGDILRSRKSPSGHQNSSSPSRDPADGDHPGHFPAVTSADENKSAKHRQTDSATTDPNMSLGSISDISPIPQLDMSAKENLPPYRPSSLFRPPNGIPTLINTSVSFDGANRSKSKLLKAPLDGIVIKNVFSEDDLEAIKRSSKEEEGEENWVDFESIVESQSAATFPKRSNANAGDDNDEDEDSVDQDGDLAWVVNDDGVVDAGSGPKDDEDLDPAWIVSEDGVVDAGEMADPDAPETEPEPLFPGPPIDVVTTPNPNPEAEALFPGPPVDVRAMPEPRSTGPPFAPKKSKGRVVDNNSASAKVENDEEAKEDTESTITERLEYLERKIKSVERRKMAECVVNSSFDDQLVVAVEGSFSSDKTPSPVQMSARQSPDGRQGDGKTPFVPFTPNALQDEDTPKDMRGICRKGESSPKEGEIPVNRVLFASNPSAEEETEKSSVEDTAVDNTEESFPKENESSQEASEWFKSYLPNPKENDQGQENINPVSQGPRGSISSKEEMSALWGSKSINTEGSCGGSRGQTDNKSLGSEDVRWLDSIHKVPIKKVPITVPAMSPGKAERSNLYPESKRVNFEEAKDVMYFVPEEDLDETTESTTRFSCGGGTTKTSPLDKFITEGSAGLATLQSALLFALSCAPSDLFDGIQGKESTKTSGEPAKEPLDGSGSPSKASINTTSEVPANFNSSPTSVVSELSAPSDCSSAPSQPLLV